MEPSTRKGVLWEVDIYNNVVAIGALSAIISWFIVHICNRTYHWPSPTHATVSRYERDTINLGAPSAWEGLRFPFFDFRTSLFWDVTAAIAITRLLLVTTTHPYNQMVAIFTEPSEMSTILFLRGFWMLLNLCFLLGFWIPAVYWLITWLDSQNRVPKAISLFFYALWLTWPFLQGIAVREVSFAAMPLEFAAFVKCPSACGEGDLQVMWKDPMENKVFIF
jgi:hypothetical protein